MSDYIRYWERPQTAIDPNYCCHCFCRQNTGGTFYCCKCGFVPTTSWIEKTDLREGYR